MASIDPIDRALVPYNLLPNSTVSVNNDLKPTVEAYLETLPKPKPFTKSDDISLVIKTLQDGGNWCREDWIIRAKSLIAHRVPELAAFDAHQAYLLAGGVYKGALKRQIKEERPFEEKNKILLVLSRALFLAGCYTESYLAIQLKVGNLDLDKPDDDASGLEVLRKASDTALHIVRDRYEGFEAVNGELCEYMLSPILRDGKVAVVKYPFIPEQFHDLSASAIDGLNERLSHLPNRYVTNFTSRCTIQKKETSATNGSSMGDTSSGVRYGVHVNQGVRKGEVLFVETTDLLARVKDPEVHEISITTCMNCLRDIPQNHLPTNQYPPKETFCNEACTREFSRHVHVPRKLFLLALSRAAVWVTDNEGRNPLEAPFIASLAANYGGTMNLSYDRHIAAAIDHLKGLDLEVSPGSEFDSAVLMNILARVQYNSRAFHDEIEGALVAVFTFFPFINEGSKANIVVDWDWEGKVAEVKVRAKRDLNAGDELFVGPVV
ncbi:hypothetical protein H2200_000710 [Cladophialophora chaetospira]|uniref:SET domain-containing protein n=1 Tax=Cladophialophora chaetospira TaxID=386627 RepID=A0AA39CPF0_9EURO|nr:hypothetical protein H2200_000710 [Cladophialophora chaetospira]